MDCESLWWVVGWLLALRAMFSASHLSKPAAAQLASFTPLFTYNQKIQKSPLIIVVWIFIDVNNLCHLPFLEISNQYSDLVRQWLTILFLPQLHQHHPAEDNVPVGAEVVDAIMVPEVARVSLVEETLEVGTGLQEGIEVAEAEGTIFTIGGKVGYLNLWRP